MALRLALACAAAAFIFGLSACGPSQKKSNTENSPGAVAGSTETPSSPAAAGPGSPQTAQSAPSSSTANSSTSPASGGEVDQVDIGSIAIETEDGANKGAPIAVDLVLVYDASLIPQLESESADAWFKGKAELMTNAANSLSIMSWTIAPGDEVPETEIDARPGVLAAFLFANYSVKGDHRLRIDGSGALKVTLGATDPTFEVEQ